MLEELEPSAAEVLRVCDQLIRNKQQEALTTMAAAIAKYPNNRDLRLLQLQTLLDQRDFTGALTACAALPPHLLHTKALQSLFFALCQHVQDTKLVDQLLEQVDAAAAENEETAVSAQQATASYFFKSQQYDLAVKSLHSLLERSSLEPTQRINLTAQLVLAAAHTDKMEAIRLGAQLPEVGIVEDVDMGELEDMLRRRDFLKHSSTAPAVAALSQPTTPVAMEEEPVVESVVDNVRKLVGLKWVSDR